MVRKTSCLLLLVVLFLTGLGHGDSHLVTPSFGSLILFSLVFKFFFFPCFIFFFLVLFDFFVLFCIKKLYLYIFFLPIKKEKKNPC